MCLGELSPAELTLLLSVLGSLTVRNEYCQAVVDQGMLKCLIDLLAQQAQARGVVKEALKSIKVLAGNDNVKKEVAKANGIPVVVTSVLNNLVI